MTCGPSPSPGVTWVPTQARPETSSPFFERLRGTRSNLCSAVARTRTHMRLHAWHAACRATLSNASPLCHVPPVPPAPAASYHLELPPQLPATWVPSLTWTWWFACDVHLHAHGPLVHTHAREPVSMRNRLNIREGNAGSALPTAPRTSTKHAVFTRTQIPKQRGHGSAVGCSVGGRRRSHARARRWLVTPRLPGGLARIRAAPHVRAGGWGVDSVGACALRRPLVAPHAAPRHSLALSSPLRGPRGAGRARGRRRGRNAILGRLARRGVRNSGGFVAGAFRPELLVSLIEGWEELAAGGDAHQGSGGPQGGRAADGGGAGEGRATVPESYSGSHTPE